MHTLVRQPLPWRRLHRREIAWPLALTVALLVGMGLLLNRPLRYTINVGYAEGWHSDLPLLREWNTPEPYGAQAHDLSYRWSGERSSIWLPGLGRRAWLITLEQLAASAHPQVAEGNFWLSGPDMAVSHPLAAHRRLHVLVTPTTSAGERLLLTAPTFTPPGDPRLLGVPIATLQLETLPAPIQLPTPRLLWPPVLLLLGWITLRLSGASLRIAALAGGLLLVLLLGTLWGDPLRFALAGPPLLIGAAWGIGVGLTTRLALPRLLDRLELAAAPGFVNGSAWLAGLSMTLRYGGRLYPESMVGDLGFHVNRLQEVTQGLIHLTSRHRGIDFPYPSAVYVLLAPLQVLPLAPTTLVEWSAALCGVLGLLAVALLTLYSLRCARVAIMAATTYALLAPPLMALWWSFLAHIFAQELVVVLIAVLVVGWPRLGRPWGMALSFAVLTLIFLGHFGLWINVSLLLAGLLALGWWRGRTTNARAPLRGLTLAFGAAQATALLLFYSAYDELIRDKIAQFLAGGMSAVQGGRPAIGRQALLASLWHDGLVAHYALIGMPLALLGGVWLTQRLRNHALVWVFWGTLAVAGVQSAIPFITASTITTRWLSFCAWAVAVGVAIVLEQLWRRGWRGQMLAILLLGWIGGTTLWMWLGALGYRIRPPEPF